MYAGRAEWQIRLDDPKYYRKDPVPYWTNFPKYLNTVTEYMFVHWKLARYLKPDETRFDGFVYRWEMVKDGNQKQGWNEYEICFETMTQTLWKGRRRDAPRHIRRCVVKVEEPARKRRRFA